MPKKRWIILIASLIIVYAAAFLGSIFTSSNINSSWYIQNKPSFTPPNYIFPIVWTILYLLIALSLFFAWTEANKKEKKHISLFFGINLLANVLWSFLFFELQNPLYAFIDLLLIWLTTIAMIFISRKVSKISAYLLIPYLLWVSFAGILNFLFLY